MRFGTTDTGYLPAGTDIGSVLRDGDGRALHAAWLTYHHIRFIHDTLTRWHADGVEVEVTNRLRVELAEVADVTALQALEANRRLVSLLTGQRWSVMQYARETGASWSTIGAALALTKQGAMDWYKRKIADREKHVGKFHDTERARAVLDE